MSISRHPAPRVRSYSITHPPGLVTLPTQPDWDQVVFTHAGLFTAHTESQAWTIPTHRALCVPDGIRLRVETTRRVAIRCLYVDTELGVLGPEVRAVNLGPLTRELMAFAVAAAPLYLDGPVEKALVTLLADQLGRERDQPLRLPLPVEETANAVAASIMSEPAVGLDDHVRAANATRRTLERRFSVETGLSLGRWRRRARVLAAVKLLAEGNSVTQVAMRVGYASPSSFVAAFRSELDSPPREFMDDGP